MTSDKINVCFDLSAAVQQTTGISRYEKQLVKALVALDGPAHYGFCYTSPDPSVKLQLGPAIESLPHRAITTSNKRWRLNIWLRQLARLRLDKMVFPTTLPAPRLFHGMDYLAPPLQAPTVLTVHDLSFLLYPQLHSFYNRTYLRLALPFHARQARRILVVSENTRRDLINWLGEGIADRVRVTGLGVSDESYFEDMPPAQLRAALAGYGLEEQGYILSVGTLEPRKNQAGLVAAYAGLLQDWSETASRPPALVLAGRIGWQGEYERVKAVATRYGLSVQENAALTGSRGQILILTEVNDTALKALYQGAKVTCYASLYEGFGLPALEAMAAGSPLITANTSSLPEVTGPDGAAALLVEPTSAAQLTQSLRRLWQDPALAQRLSQAGRERARHFSWRRTAELTRQVYQEIQGCYDVKHSHY
jgi:glycosyltransferase involved in cell wall biosynthesis